MPALPEFDYEATLAACAAGERAAMQRLYAQEGGRLLGVVQRIVRDAALAEDIVHDACVNIWTRAAAFDPARGVFLSLLKPIALKNQSIDVIRDFEPCVPMGPSFPGTRKGTVAHVAPDARAVAHRHQPARPGVVLLPQWRQGSPTQITMVPPDRLFSALAYNAFNYTTLGEVGFSAVVGLARTCPGHALVYSDLADALAAIDQLWSQHSDGAAP